MMATEFQLALVRSWLVAHSDLNTTFAHLDVNGDGK